MWTEGFPGRTVLRLDYNAQLGGIEDSLEDPIGNALGQIVDEACEATADRFESDFAFGDGVLRLWFGLVPPARPATEWRKILPELPPIPLDDCLVKCQS
jgi:hypothetical protein